MTYDEIVSRYYVRGRGRGTCQCICPCHNDLKASLTITKSGYRTLVYCHAGCRTEDILAAKGLRMEDLFDEEICGRNAVSVSRSVRAGRQYAVPAGKAGADGK